MDLSRLDVGQVWLTRDHGYTYRITSLRTEEPNEDEIEEDGEHEQWEIEVAFYSWRDNGTGTDSWYYSLFPGDYCYRWSSRLQNETLDLVTLMYDPNQ